LTLRLPSPARLLRQREWRRLDWRASPPRLTGPGVPLIADSNMGVNAVLSSCFASRQRREEMRRPASLERSRRQAGSLRFDGARDDHTASRPCWNPRSREPGTVKRGGEARQSNRRHSRCRSNRAGERNRSVKQTARAKALDLLARRDEALRSLEKSKPPELSADELRQEIHRLINELTPGADIERAAPMATQSIGMAP